MWIVEFSGFHLYKQLRVVFTNCNPRFGSLAREIVVDREALRFNQWNRLLFLVPRRCFDFFPSADSSRRAVKSNALSKVRKAKLFILENLKRFEISLQSEILEVDGNQTVFPVVVIEKYLKCHRQSIGWETQGKHHENVSPTHNCDF